MKRALPILLLTAVALGLWAGCSRTHQTTTASGQVVTGDKAASIERLRDAGTDLQELMNAPDAAVPQEVLKAAKCVAIVPDMVKGGFVVGGRHGRGVATCRTETGCRSIRSCFAWWPGSSSRRCTSRAGSGSRHGRTHCTTHC